MKRAKVLWFVALCSSLLCVCFVVSSSPPFIPESFFGVLGSDCDESISSVQQTSDGGYILTGKTDFYGDVDILLLKIASNGTLEWGRVIDSGEDEYGNSVSQTTDGGYIVTGVIEMMGKNLLIGKFLSNGDLVWASRIGYSEDVVGEDVVQTVDGDFVVVGITLGLGRGSYDMVVAKFHSVGSLDWAMTYGSIESESGYSIKKASDGGFFVTGDSLCGTGNNRRIVLAKFSSSGSLEWASMYGNLADENDDIYGTSVHQTTADDGYIIGGRVMRGSSSYDIVFGKFSSNGTVLWSFSFGEGTGYHAAYSVFEDQRSPSGYILSGRVEGIHPENEDYDNAFLMRFFDNGTLDWLALLGEKYYNMKAFSAANTMDGGFVMVGMMESGVGGPGASVDATILKTDSHGEALLGTAGCPSWVKVPNEDVSSLFSTDFQLVAEGNGSLCSESLFADVHTFDFSFSYVDASLTETVLSLAGEFEYSSGCSVTGECFGVMDVVGDLNDVCSGNGDCIIVETTGKCHCYPNYYGRECEITVCDGHYSNETEEVCNGRGKCTMYNECQDCVGSYGSFCQNSQHASYFGAFGGAEGYGQAVLSLEDGGLVVASHLMGLSGQIGGYDAVLTKFFSNGSLAWSTCVGYAATAEYVYSIHEGVGQGKYIVSGTTSFDCSGESNGMTLNQFSDDGSLDWTVCVGVSGGYVANMFQSVIATSDGYYVAVGYSNSIGEGATNIVIAKFDSSGSFQAASTLGETGPQTRLRAFSVVESEGGYVLVGDYQYESSTPYNLLIVKFSQSLSLEWVSRFGMLEEHYYYGKDVIEVEEDNGEKKLVVVGYTGQSGYQDRSGFLLLKFFDNGVLEWAVKSQGEDITYPEGNSLIEDKSSNRSGYVVTGMAKFGVLGENKASIVLFKYSKSGQLQWAVKYKTRDDRVEEGIDVQGTGDGGYVIAGCTSKFFAPGKDVFVMKVYREGKACDEVHGMDVLEYFTTEYITGYAVPQFQFTLIAETATLIGNVGPISPTVVSLTDTLVVNDTKCSSEFSCFGSVGESQACSGGKGVCMDNEHCECDPSDVYFGTECDVTLCFNVFSNDTSAVCSGHGRCEDFNRCQCSSIHYNGSDCSMWKCFGKWRNESGVCNPHTAGKHADRSFGNCTSHDHCECVEGYQESLKCEFSCSGVPYWEDEACGESGLCVDHDTCNCTTKDYAGEDCDVPTCDFIPRGEFGVCSGHGSCESPNECDCELGYSPMSIDNNGRCDLWTCFGIDMVDTKVCSKHGECELYNLCKCKNKYDGENCQSWSCGKKVKDDPDTCSGKGRCRNPDTCDCDQWFAGESCGTNTLYTTVLAPSGGTVGMIVVIVFLYCLCVACVICYACLVVLNCGLCLTCCLVIDQSKGLRRFGKLQNFDLLLKEQELESDSSIAHMKIDSSLFEIDIESIKTISILGEGGSSSIVFKSLWNGKHVAFKCFKTRTMMATQDKFEEFEREVRILASVSHPNIIRFFGACLKPPRVGIVMEFCSKGEILDFVKDFRKDYSTEYPFLQKMRLLSEICSSLEYLHSKNIIHRDLKCENVLISGDDSAKLMDFGLSRCVESMSVQKTKRIGTSVYMAPELVSSNNYDERCDVFSFALMMYILLTENENPYEGMANEFQIEFKVANNSNFRPKIDALSDDVNDEQRWLKNLITQCWDHDPENRPSCLEIREVIEKEGSVDSFERKNVRKNVSGDSKGRLQSSITVIEGSEEKMKKLKEENDNLKKEMKAMKQQMENERRRHLEEKERIELRE